MPHESARDTEGGLELLLGSPCCHQDVAGPPGEAVDIYDGTKMESVIRISGVHADRKCYCIETLPETDFEFFFRNNGNK
ncbi:hypothetical protein NDU88_005582 [Pleurodeles waltl]|uniref:Uncharacterized protein n=1 Tax=Pleurodeles waltl TaxID=8319 RepID=A0AAV7TVV2_PLEWA|nr:hypothetical protein NDU88_005582 [Pleurodeles waltl]